MASKIPKRISFFWTGRMSWMRWLTLDTFVRLNPDWEVHLYVPPEETIIPRHWTSKSDDDNSYGGLDYRERLHPSIQIHTFYPPTRMAAAQMCDLFQWELLSTKGGIYADLDILWLRPMDEIITSYLDSDILLCLEPDILAIGFVGSSPNCPFFQRVFNRAQILIKRKKPSPNYQYYGASLLHCMFTGGRRCISTASVLRHIKSEYPNLQLGLLPPDSIYPFDWQEVHKVFEEVNPVSNSSLGLHWFGGCPASNHWNNTLTKENWTIHKNTFTSCLEKSYDKHNLTIPTATEPARAPA